MSEGRLSEAEQRARREAVIKAFTMTPFMGSLKLAIERYEPDDVIIRLPFREDLTNDGTFYHGGVVAALLDTAGAAAAWSNHDFNKGVNASTIGLSIQFVGAARKSDLIARATTTKRGRELIFTAIDAFDVDDRPVAHAIQTYRIV